MTTIKLCLLNKAYYALCLTKICRAYHSAGHAEQTCTVLRSRRRKERRYKERGGTVGWPVVLSPSGTCMDHDGRRRAQIFHCQSPGGTAIHFFFSLISGSTLSLWFCVSVKCQFNHNTQLLVSREWGELQTETTQKPKKYAGEEHSLMHDTSPSKSLPLWPSRCCLLPSEEWHHSKMHQTMGMHTQTLVLLLTTHTHTQLNK